MKKVIGILLSAYFCSAQAAKEACTVPAGALLPDLLSTVPHQLGLQNRQQEEVIRFSNAIANLGQGLWWLEPEFPGTSDVNQVQSAYQVFANSTTITDDLPPADSSEVLGRCKKGEFAFHPSHNHWHINHVAEFKVCEADDFLANKAAGNPNDCHAVPVSSGVAASVKVTFCLIDWVKLGEKTTNSDSSRNFWDCSTSFQGVSPGWADQYHHSTPDQQIYITGIEPGEYYVVTTANYDELFEETAKDNNTSWVKIQVSRDSKGNAKIAELGTACDDQEYLNKVTAAVNNFTTDPAKRAKILSNMCGNISTNR